MNALTKASPLAQRASDAALQPSQLDYILIDGSQSMQAKWWETLGAVDAFCDVLRAQGVASRGILTTFCSMDINLVHRDSSIADWKRFDVDPIGSHWGMTPLYDAINMMGRQLRDIDPKNASIVIATDGDENCSSHTDATQAKAILDWCRAKGWQVTFLGVDFNNEAQALALGSNTSNTIAVRKMKLLEAGRTLGKKRARHAAAGTDISFTDDEKTNFGGYLAAPKSGA